MPFPALPDRSQANPGAAAAQIFHGGYAGAITPTLAAPAPAASTLLQQILSNAHDAIALPEVISVGSAMVPLDELDARVLDHLLAGQETFSEAERCLINPANMHALHQQYLQQRILLHESSLVRSRETMEAISSALSAEQWPQVRMLWKFLAQQESIRDQSMQLLDRKIRMVAGCDQA